MAREYQQRFGTPFDVLHNGAADELFADGPDEVGTSGAVVVRYIGALLRDQHWEAIEDFVEAVKLVNQEGHDVRFEIYCDKWTADLAKELADNKSTVYAGFAAKPRNYELLKSADLLLLPVTFSDKYIGAYSFSMPTKLCEYLGSGTSTLIYGPRGPAAVELCVRNNIGLVQTERSVQNLVEVLRKLVADRNHFREIGSRDRLFAKENLSAQSMAERFRELMNDSSHKMIGT
jgi:glycosyltransferase involved in cell wall biosynthesis